MTDLAMWLMTGEALRKVSLNQIVSVLRYYVNK